MTVSRSLLPALLVDEGVVLVGKDAECREGAAADHTHVLERVFVRGERT
jgi:hypothetical protein